MVDGRGLAENGKRKTVFVPEPVGRGRFLCAASRSGTGGFCVDTCFPADRVPRIHREPS